MQQQAKANHKWKLLIYSYLINSQETHKDGEMQYVKFLKNSMNNYSVKKRSAIWVSWQRWIVDASVKNSAIYWRIVAITLIALHWIYQPVYGNTILLLFISQAENSPWDLDLDVTSLPHWPLVSCSVIRNIIKQFKPGSDFIMYKIIKILWNGGSQR